MALCLLLFARLECEAQADSPARPAQCDSDLCRLPATLSLIREARALDLCDEAAVERHFLGSEKEIEAANHASNRRFFGSQRLLGLRLTHYGATQKAFKKCTLSLSPPDPRVGAGASLRPIIRLNDLAQLIEVCPIRAYVQQPHAPSTGAYTWCGQLREQALDVSFLFYEGVLNSVLIQTAEN